MIYEYQKVKEVPCDGPRCGKPTPNSHPIGGKIFCSGNCYRNFYAELPRPQLQMVGNEYRQMHGDGLHW